MDIENKQKVPNRASLDGIKVIDKAFNEAESGQEVLPRVLELMLEIFDCDRAWLLYPCKLNADSYAVPMERTRPLFPGAGATNEQIPIDGGAATIIHLALNSERPVALDAINNHTEAFKKSHSTLDRFQIKSQLVQAIHPPGDDPWLLGIHNCRAAVDYGNSSELFHVIGQRMADSFMPLVAMEGLSQSDQRFATLVQHAPEAVAVLDLDLGIFIDANKNAEELFGLSHKELLDLPGPIAVSPTFQPDGQSSETAAAKYIGLALQGGFPSFRWDHLHSSGKVLPCQVTLAQLPHATRTILRGSITDIGNRISAEEKRLEFESHLAQSQKMEAIGKLTGGIAHDFNNLLTVIFGNLDILEVQTDASPNVLESARHIRAAADRARSLTHRLLAFARRQPLRPHDLNIGHLLRGMEDILRQSLGEQIETELVVGGGVWMCRADHAQLENAILNISINARDAMTSGGRLTIEVSNSFLDSEYASSQADLAPGQYVLIAVTDTGVGMPEEVLAQAFTPFFTTKTTHNGTGLGLSMVYGFVKQSGGHLQAYSEVGVGTTLKIYLPRSVTNDAFLPPVPQASQANQGNGELILVVEDEDEVRKLTVTLLQHLGYRTLDSADAAGGLQLLEEQPGVDMLLTDIVLIGVMNGAELAKIAKEMRPNLPVLYMSGYTANAIIHNGTLDAGVTLLQKPFTKRSLAISVCEVLQERGKAAS
mgnify:FL=1